MQGDKDDKGDSVGLSHSLALWNGALCMSKADDVRKFLDCVREAKLGYRIGGNTDQNLWAWLKRRSPPRDAAGLRRERHRLRELATRLWDLLNPSNRQKNAHSVWTGLKDCLLRTFKRAKHREHLTLLYGEGGKWDSTKWKEFVTGLCPESIPARGSSKGKGDKRQRIARALSEAQILPSRIRNIEAPAPNFSPTAHFQPRWEMDHARNIFSDGLKHKRAVRLRLTGSYWNGKKEIARKLAAEFGEQHFPGGRIEVQLNRFAHDQSGVRQALSSIVHRYTRGPLPEDEGALRDWWRKHLGGRRSLVILLDAHETQDLTWLMPPEESSWVIVTSDGSVSFNSTDAIAVGGLAPLEAQELAILLGEEQGITPAEAAQLVGDLGGNPGSINELMKIVGHLRVEVSFEEILAVLNQDLWQMLSPFARVLELKYSGLSAPERQFWKQLAVFPSDFDSAAALAVAGGLPPSSARILSKLRTWSCIHLDPNQRRYRLEHLHRKFLLENKLKQNQRSHLEQAHAEYYFTQVAQNAAQRRNRSMSLEQGRIAREFVNIAAAFQWASDHKPEMCLSFVKDAHRVLFYGLRVKQTVEWAEQALDCADDATNKHALALATHLLGVGRAWQGKHHEAKQLYLRAESYLNESTLKDDAWRNDLLLIKGGIGWVLNDNGDSDATEFFSELLKELKHNNCEPEVMVHLYLIEGLAESFLRRKMPCSKEAIECYELMAELLKPKHLTFERNYYSHLVERGLGWARSLLNEHAEAEQRLTRAVDLAHKMDQGTKAAVSLGKLGFAQLRAGRLKPALESLDKGLELAMSWQLFGYAAEIRLDRCKVLLADKKREEAINEAQNMLKSHDEEQFPRLRAEIQAWLRGIKAD